MPSARLLNEACITSFWPRMLILRGDRQVLAHLAIARWISAATDPRSRPSIFVGDVDDPLHRVVVDRFQAGVRIDAGDVAQPHRRMPRAGRWSTFPELSRAADRRVQQVGQFVDPVDRRLHRHRCSSRCSAGLRKKLGATSALEDSEVSMLLATSRCEIAQLRRAQPVHVDLQRRDSSAPAPDADRRRRECAAACAAIAG